MNRIIGDLRHFSWLGPELASRLFHSEPRPIAQDGDAERLAMALGATLYMPSTRPTIARDVLSLTGRGVVSVVLCLEDAVPDEAIRVAEANLVAQLKSLAAALDDDATRLPMIFVRVRELAQMRRVVDQAGDSAQLLFGFVLPKFEPESGRLFLDEVKRLRADTGASFMAMPVLESAKVLHLESRLVNLLEIKAILAEYPDQVLAIRIGATDLLALYGLRRGRNITVHEIPLLADALADIVNVLGRPMGGHVVTGPVWEYFGTSDRLFKPQLRQTPFELRDAAPLRLALVSRDLDGLIRETVLDRANGLMGKSVIHPSHILPVHALSVVPYEEYKDAVDIIDGLATGGVRASSFRNKMNEGKPHAAWARRTLIRGDIFGVAAPEATFVEFLMAGEEVAARRGSRP